MFLGGSLVIAHLFVDVTVPAGIFRGHGGAAVAVEYDQRIVQLLALLKGSDDVADGRVQSGDGGGVTAARFFRDVCISVQQFLAGTEWNRGRGEG